MIIGYEGEHAYLGEGLYCKYCWKGETEEESERAAIHDNNSSGYNGECDGCGDVVGVRNGEDPGDYWDENEDDGLLDYQEYDEYPEEEETEVAAE